MGDLLDEVPFEGHRTVARGAKEERRGRTLEFGLELLQRIVECRQGVGARELARQTSQDNANTYRILRVLCNRGFVVQDPVTKRYRPGPELAVVAGALLRNLDVRVVAQSVMPVLLRETGETVHLALKTPGGGVYVAQERPPSRVSVETDIGGSPVIYCTATGKALFSGASLAELRSALPREWTQFTASTHTSIEALGADLRKTRERGYAIDNEELQVGVRCVAAPIRDHFGDVIASIGVSGPAERMPLDRMAQVGSVLVRAAGQISRGIGGGGVGMQR